ncbi:MAG: OmpA family protein [Myxococcota bacterium]|nr:OmpA family protein [Myxococcota bacterium]
MAPGRALVLGLLALPLLGGCVGAATHRKVVAERDALAERLRSAEATNQSLESERIRVLEEHEDLRERHETLDVEARKLRIEHASLSADLAEKTETLEELQSTYQGLVDDLETELAAGEIQIRQLRDGLQLNLSQEILFPSGSAQLTSRGTGVIARVAGQLQDDRYRVQVVGHSDDQKIGGALAKRYPSNWELAGARAAGVVRVLESEGVVAARLAAMSLGEHHPVATNETAEGRARNRRIEIRLIPLEPGEARAAAAPDPR